MIKKDLKKYKIPKNPGVYIFRGTQKKLLYIGKATNLKDRVRSYFSKDLPKSRGALIVKMLESAKSVEWQETDSVLEALILEANLIKKHQPPYNTKEKSDKSFNYIAITQEDFPRIITIRDRELLSTPTTKSDYKYTFGPFANGSLLKAALKIIRKIFPYRDKCKIGAAKPCFAAQIGLCPGVCVGKTNKKEYARTIRNIALLFQGKKSALIKQLTKEMNTLAKKENFEAAAQLRNKITALRHINDVALIKNDVERRGEGIRIEAYDIAHTSETARLGVMTVIIDGIPNKKSYRKFNIRTKAAGDTAALEEVLQRRFAHNEWEIPHLIVVDGGAQQVNVAKKVLREFAYKIPIAAVTKDARHKPKSVRFSTVLVQWNRDDVLLANAEAHRFALSAHRKKRDKIR